MIKLINRLLVRFVSNLNRRAFAEGEAVVVISPRKNCGCQIDPMPGHFDAVNVPVGEWEGPVKHPHPLFPKLKCERRPILRVARCKFCGGLTNAAGWDFRDIKPNA